MAFDDQEINWSEFFKAYSGVRFTIKKDECQIFVPNYANVAHSRTRRTSGGEVETLPMSGTDMTFRDEWSSNAFLVAGEPERLDEVFIKDLWEFPENNVKWDDFLEQLSFQDIDVAETTLLEFVSDLDSFLVFNKLNKFGDVWWVANIKAEIESDDSQYSNVEVPNVSGSDGGEGATKVIKFWSPDKYINDEYKRYVANPASYSGFLVSDDFETGGWFSVPHLRISTKPFEKLKIAEALLNINYTFEPSPYFGGFYSVDSTMGARIKDSTSITILDTSQSKASQNEGFFADTIISNWVGGLISSDNIETIGALGNFTDDACAIKRDEINNIVDSDNPNALSHAIDAQITIKTDYSSDKRDFLGTIDPINWISVDTPPTENAHTVGALNTDRAFGGASGDINAGLIVGGIRTTSDSVTNVLSNGEIWNNDTFIRNVLIDLNSPRCFHIQGGSGSSTCAVVGGFGNMNTDDFSQFSRYGKGDVRSDMEYFVTNDDPTLAFFRKIADYTMNTPRGDSGGTLEVTTNVRQDKFEAENLARSYNLTPDDEQTVAEFINDASTDTKFDSAIPSNFRRYNVSNIEGFVYAGNTSGNVYLIDIPSTVDIIDSFETINTTHVDVSENLVGTTDTSSARTPTFVLENGISDVPTKIIDPVLTISGINEQGNEVSLTECGKYRVEYINGSYLLQDGNAGEVIDKNIVVDSTDNVGETVTVPYDGLYEISYVDGTYFNNSVPTSSFTIDVDGSLSGGTSFSINRCGIYRIQIIAGAIQFSNDGSISSPDYNYLSSIDLLKPGGSWTSLIAGTSEKTIVAAFAHVAGTTVDVCFDESEIGTSYIRFPDTFYADNSLSMAVSITYIGTNASSCPACGDTRIGVYKNEDFQQYIFDGNTDSYNICLEEDSEIKLLVPNASSGNSGAVSAKLTFVTADCTSVSGASEIYSSNTNVYINEQFSQEIFVSGVLDSQEEVELFNQGRPTRQGYTFCVEQPGSTLRFAPNDVLDEDYENNGGHLNLRVLYIGEEYCPCFNLDSETQSQTTDTTTVTDTEVTIVYGAIDETKTYPLRCHGMVYVGDKDSGLSTGGRTEYNRISDVECQIREKYGLVAKNSCGTPYSSNDLEKDRVLDLVYEYDGSTWIRRQNLFESVYYHTGVGDEVNSIFWGGLHDTISEYSYSFTIDGSVDPETIPISAFECGPERNFTTNDEILQATSYDRNTDIINSDCWAAITNQQGQIGAPTSTPVWETYIVPTGNTEEKLLIKDDPRYVPGEATLAYASSPNFPEILVVSSYPTNPASLTEQTSGSVNYASSSTFRLSIDADYPADGEAQFDVRSYILNGDGTVSTNTIDGSIRVIEVPFINLEASESPLFPSGVPSMSGDFTFELTDIQTFSGGQTTLYYSVDLQEFDGASNLTYRLNGFGELKFDSMQDIWNVAKTSSTIDATEVTFTIQLNTEYPESVGTTIGGTARVKFESPQSSITLVGVSTTLEEWNAQSARCGPDLSTFISLDAEYTPLIPSRWGTPLWVGGLVEETSGLLKLDYDYNTSEEIGSDIYGINEYQVTTVDIQANDLSAIINDRTLIQANTVNQYHEFTAIKDITFSVSTTACNFDSSAAQASACDCMSISGFGMGSFEDLTFGGSVPKMTTIDVSSAQQLEIDNGVTVNIIPVNDKFFIGPTDCDVLTTGHTYAGCHSFGVYDNLVGLLPLEEAIKLIDPGLTLPRPYPDESQECFLARISATGNPAMPMWIDLEAIPLYSMDCPMSGANIPVSTLPVSSVDLSGMTINEANKLAIVFDINDYSYCPQWAIENVTLPYDANYSCETIDASFSSSIDSSGTGESYAEWGSSFIQEYQSDERFSLPESFVPSNASGIIGNNRPLTYEPSRWKRFMDGVGLGGDVPDYSTIVDSNGNELPVQNWRTIGSWYVGQMAFGSPQAAVVVGGHKVDPNKKKVGIHAHQTDKRVFKWDFTNIPPEDTYLTNYLGRRMWSFYINDDGIIVPSDTNSSFGLNIFDAESTVTVERYGRVIFSGGDDKKTVTFTEPLPEEVGDNYSITLLPNDNIKAWWNNKSIQSFDVFIETDTWVGEIDYVVSANLKVTEEDIQDLDDLDGYIFNK